MGTIFLKGSVLMKILRKYSIYVVLLVATATLGSIGYINESRKEAVKEKNKPQEITYATEKITIKAEKPEPLAEETAAVATAEKETPAPEEKVTYTKPVVGEPIEKFSGNNMIFSETMDDFRTHNGQDFACNSGEEIFAVAKGVVTDIYEDDFLGLCLQIEHPDGIITKYCALSEAKVNIGDKIEGGSAVAIAGSSAKGESAKGIHLHFEALKGGVYINPETLFN